MTATAAAMDRADRTRADPWSTDEEVAAAFSAPLALTLAIATVLIVLGNLLAGSGALLHLALFRTAESRYSQHPMRLKRYYNEFQRPPPPTIDPKTQEDRSIAPATASAAGTGDEVEEPKAPAEGSVAARVSSHSLTPWSHKQPVFACGSRVGSERLLVLTEGVAEHV